MPAIAGILGSSALAAIGPGAAFGSALWFQGFLINSAIGLALYALSPKPNLSSINNRGYQTTQFGTSQPMQVVYGRARVGGVRVYDEVTGTNNKYLHRVIAFTGHEIEDFDEIYINDEVVVLDGTGNVTSPAVYDGFVRIKKHLGSPTQTADSDLIAESSSWTLNHRLRGISYLYVRMLYDGDVFPSGIPEITATIKGKKLYDPRTSLTEWSDNPALCLRDYLTNTYGLNEDDARIDDDYFKEAANICDEDNTLAGDTRYTCNGSFLIENTPYDTIGALVSSMGGTIWYAQGSWKVRPAHFYVPTLSLDEDDLRSSISVTTRHARRDNYNAVAGKFRGEESNWQTTDFPPVTNDAFLSADNGESRSIDLELPFTDNSVEARRIARIVLERNRQQLTINAKFGLRAFSAQIGDNVFITNSRFGWTNKVFEVVNWEFGFDDGFKPYVDMTLRETAESAFDEVDDGLVYELDNTNLYNPFEVPTVGLVTDIETDVINERVLITLVVTIDSGRATEINSIELEYKLSTDTNYTTVGNGHLGTYRILDVEPTTYDVRARALNILGIHGEWTTIQVVVTPDEVSVSDVTNFKYDLSGGFITLSWDPVTDLGLSYYKIRHALEESGATWANATTAVDRIARPATSVTLPARPGTYYIRAISKTGQVSENSATVVVPETAMEDFSNTSTQTESPTFSGTDSNTDTVSSELVLASYATAPATGEYTFSNYIDTTSARRARVRIDLETRRKDDSGGLFDDLNGNVDSFPGLWDDLTGFTQFDDTNVITYISTTTDDPAGTPTWTSYQPFLAGEYYGRAFRFKVKLDSDSDDVTPAIDAMTARVQYN